ncbi:MAG: 6-phosphogluconolactonase [Candidatus Kariarchaeaceae archaeon]|jgi:6-phosphogluconolactonase
MYTQDTLEKVSHQVADYLFKKISMVLSQKDTCIIALSGGNTPVQTYQLLSDKLAQSTLKDSVQFIQVDERWVDKEDEKSNQRMIRQSFQSHSGFHQSFLSIPTLTSTGTIDRAAMKYNKDLEALLTMGRKRVIDIALFGMGEDAHTASLFPYNMELENFVLMNKTDLCLAVEAQLGPRISLSPVAIDLVNNPVVMITGFNKGAILQNAIVQNNPIHYPVNFVLRNDPAIFMDKACYQGYSSAQKG